MRGMLAFPIYNTDILDKKNGVHFVERMPSNINYAFNKIFTKLYGVTERFENAQYENIWNKHMALVIEIPPEFCIHKIKT